MVSSVSQWCSVVPVVSMVSSVSQWCSVVPVVSMVSYSFSVVFCSARGVDGVLQFLSGVLYSARGVYGVLSFLVFQPKYAYYTVKE